MTRGSAFIVAKGPRSETRHCRSRSRSVSSSTRDCRLRDPELAAQLARDGVGFRARRQIADDDVVGDLLALFHRTNLRRITGSLDAVVERKRAVLLVGPAKDHAEAAADARDALARLQLRFRRPLVELRL